MNSDDQIRLNRLEDELKAANRDAEETRLYFSSELGRSTTEARLYRGLFWGLLAIAAVLAIISILQQ
jgi:hypothetical protein